MKRLLALLLSLAIASNLSAQEKENEKKQLRAGAALSNITPEIGGLVVGGFNPEPSTHIHDELHVRCLVLDNGETKLAFAVCDLLGADRDMYEQAASLVEKETGIPRSHLMMSATHTHSASSALGSDRLGMPRPPLDAYQLFVARRIADGVKRALNSLQPARIGWGSGQEPNHVFNRRWFMKEGTVPVNPFGEYDQVKMNPPRASKDLVKPAGPTDPEISMLSIQTADGKPLAVLANYSLHYVGGVGNGHVSADYFPLFCKRLGELMGVGEQDPPFVGLLSNGTSGNINNIDFSKPGTKSLPYERMRQVADEVAQAAYKGLQGITKYHDWVPLDARFRELTLGARRPTPAQLDRAKGLVDKPRLIGGKSALDVIYAERTLKLANYPETLPIPVQAFRVGDVGVTGIPCETFVETGLELKAKSPLKPAFTHSIANGYYGYLPTPEHHKLGGYETWLGTNRLEVEASVKITKALLEMLGEMAKQ
ncbi:hypothetical protein DES53_10458 [Roseimicrobium gellanilyticum]|uniref:Neutral/alkaline ceramidase-like enzyme n=1 Tax=Roseimicrobium gellanilyticum TaxID=748857 RepID=A0A366HM71_9BACT|nr:hypothetical protein [Roseimicrobium gellanilyticum]RBP44239.1 hypothetical protein DES53_10458 [Roseimicrobium gellanilyticum]